MIGLVFIAIVVTLLTHWIRKWRTPSCSGVLPPGSMGLPWIGETIQLVIPSNSLDLHSFIKKRINRYGPVFRSRIAGKPIVFTADPDFNHYIVSQEGKSVELWYLDAFTESNVQDADESGTQATKTYIHKCVRNLYLSQLGAENLKNNFLPLIQNTIHKALRSWTCQQTVEVKYASSKVLCNLMMNLLFSFDIDNPNDELCEKLLQILDGLMSLPLNVPGTKYHRSMKNQNEVKDFLKKLLKERLASTGKAGPVDLLGHVVANMEKEKFMTEGFVIQTLFGALFPSVEAISTTVTLLFKFLSSHPRALEQLTVEHNSLLTNRTTSRASITWDEYKSMPFTFQVINEALRMANNVPGLLRRTLKDITYQGYTIPAGWIVMVLTSACQMNPEIFKDPEVFNPWRWQDIEPSALSKNFTPFGGGTRQCAGAEYSKVFLAIFLHVLVTNFRWDKIKEGKISRSPILGFGNGLHIKLHHC